MQRHGENIYLSMQKKQSFIIDMKGNLNTVIQTIETLKAAARQDIVDETRKSYRRDIDTKINEATDFINGDITPEIKRISGILDTNMEALVNETIDRRLQAEKELKKYLESQAKLQNQIGIRAILGFVNVASQFGACLGPYGMAASSIANGVTQIGEGFLADSTVTKVMSLPAGVKTTLDQFNDALKTRNDEKIAFLDGEIKKN